MRSEIGGAVLLEEVEAKGRSHQQSTVAFYDHVLRNSGVMLDREMTM